jgi:hypothetical protein
MWHRFKKFGLMALFFMGLFFCSTGNVQAASWNYGITNTDTPNFIDTQQTTAKVDPAAHEITLPLKPALTSLIAMNPDGGYEYGVLTTEGVKVYSFNGTEMVENTLLEVSSSNPVAVAMPSSYPTVTVANKTGIKQYLFDGSGMTNNTALEVAGLTNVVSVASVNSNVIATLDDGQAKVFQLSDNKMVPNTILEPKTALSNPIDLAIDECHSMAILEPDKVRYFNYDGTGMTENPSMVITGLNNAKAFSLNGKEVAVIDGNQVKHYSFDGNSMVYNSFLSVSVNNPRDVVIKPGSNDRIILDGNEVKYYNWNGSGLVYNPALSKKVDNIVNEGGYKPYAQVQSLVLNPGNAVEQVRVRAYHELPVGTSVEWSVTADEINWVKRWRVRGISGGTTAEITNNNGISWTTIGNETNTRPNVNIPNLWTTVPEGSNIRWRAELITTNTKVTPKIIAVSGVAVNCETNSRPVCSIDPVPGWIYTTTPTFTWKFTDADPIDTQSAYRLVIKKISDNQIVYDTGKIMGNQNSYRLTTSYNPNIPGPLWMANDYRFKIEIKVWDSKNLDSLYTTPVNFKVLAFERPRIAEIVSPPAGQIVPVMGQPNTHLMILPGMKLNSLPKTKAGARVTMLVDSVGPIKSPPANIASIYYTGGTCSLGDTLAEYPLASVKNRWTIPFWTDAALNKVPTGTIVKVSLAGEGTEGGVTNFNIPPYADGVVMTAGSIYEDWFVILQGGNKK